jgi:transcriptional regulator with XRE-family HTH domain
MPPANGNSFAILLRACRKRAGLSQQQLSDYLAVGKSRVSKWETGVSDPPRNPAFYESLRNVPGVTESEIALLLEASEYTGDLLSQRSQGQGSRSVLPLSPQAHLVVYIKELHWDAFLIKINASENVLILSTNLLYEEVNHVLSEASELANEVASQYSRGGSGAFWVRLQGVWTWSGFDRIRATPQGSQEIGYQFIQYMSAEAFLIKITPSENMVLLDGDLYYQKIDTVISEAFELAEAASRHNRGGAGKVWARFDDKWLPLITLTYSSGLGSIPVRNPSNITDIPQNIVISESESLRIHYSHTMPEHGTRIVGEGKWQPSDKPEQSPQAPAPGSGVIYDRGRLTTLAEASRTSGLKVGTLRNYLSDGKLTERGRIIASGGGKVLIDLDELDSVLSSRKPGGRPRKIPERMVNKRPRGRPRKTPRTEGVEPKLLTLKEAVETHGVAYETLRSWYRSGHLPERGREVFSTHGGGKILVDEQDVIRLKSQPPARGRPSTKTTQ